METERIVSVRAVPRSYRLASPFRFASAELESLAYVLVRVETSSGVVGYGEAPAYWDPTGETQGSALGALEFVTPLVEGQSALDAKTIGRMCERTIRGAFSARFALETALLDIAGQYHAVPLHVLLGGPSGDPDVSVPLNAVVPLGKDLGVVREAVKKHVEDGFRVVKVKLRGDAEADRALVTAVVENLPGDVQWVGDANQAWESPKVALREIRELLEFRPLFIEQPLVADDREGLALLRHKLPVDIVADESAISTRDVLELLVGGVVDMVNLKLAKTGGLFEGLAAAFIAQTLRRDFVLGSMVEGSLGMLANFHFAVATSPLCCGLTAHWLIEDREDVGLTMEAGQLKLASTKPGLGYPDAEEFERNFR